MSESFSKPCKLKWKRGTGVLSIQVWLAGFQQGGLTWAIPILVIPAAHCTDSDEMKKAITGANGRWWQITHCRGPDGGSAFIRCTRVVLALDTWPEKADGKKNVTYNKMIVRYVSKKQECSIWQINILYVSFDVPAVRLALLRNNAQKTVSKCGELKECQLDFELKYSSA